MQVQALSNFAFPQEGSAMPATSKANPSPIDETSYLPEQWSV